MSIRKLIPLLAACSTVLLAAGCANNPPTEEQAAQRCQSWRNYARTKAADYVMEECSHQMGAQACKQCLNP